MKKILFLVLSFCFFTSACGLMMRPKALSENAADISMYVYSQNAHSILTFWRKINDDGSKGKRFSLEFRGGIYQPSYTRVIKLDAGAYYLDSFQINYSRSFIVSQAGHFLTRNGWDDSQKQPKYLSFRVSENQNIVLPKIEIIANTDEKNKIASFEIKLDSEENSNIITIGTLSKSKNQ